MKPYLIVVRCGDDSLHPSWLPKDPKDRNWDLLINYFGDSPQAFRHPESQRIDTKGPKFVGLHQLLCEHADLISKYKYVWFPDDDLLFSFRDANLFFSYCEKYNVSIAQPALDPKSFLAFPITIHNLLFSIRFTSIVEVMAPCFQTQILLKVRESFKHSQTGGGLDYVWPFLIGEDAKRMAIVDAVQVLHTRPLGGANHYTLRERGITILEEIAEVMRRFGVRRRHYFVFAGVLRGTKRVFRSPRLALLFVLAIGTVIGAFRMDKWPFMYKWKAILGYFRWQFRPPGF